MVYANFMLIYVKITDRQTDKHIKSIVRNLTKFKKKLHVGIQCPEQTSQEERVFIISSKQL